jgi:hypothetical protein
MLGGEKRQKNVRNNNKKDENNPESFEGKRTKGRGQK